MTTQEYLIKTQNEKAEMARIDDLQANATETEKKANLFRRGCLIATIIGTICHMYGFLFNPIMPIIGLTMYLIVGVFGFKVINLDDKAEKLQKVIKQRRKSLSRGNVETLLQLPVPNPNIEYQDSVTTYDKKIVKLNKR